MWEDKKWNKILDREANQTQQGNTDLGRLTFTIMASYSTGLFIQFLCICTCVYRRNSFFSFRWPFPVFFLLIFAKNILVQSPGILCVDMVKGMSQSNPLEIGLD